MFVSVKVHDYKETIKYGHYYWKNSARAPLTHKTIYYKDFKFLKYPLKYMYTIYVYTINTILQAWSNVIIPGYFTITYKMTINNDYVSLIGKPILDFLQADEFTVMTMSRIQLTLNVDCSHFFD